MEKDYRQGQKVVATIDIEDRGQDFIELDLLANGVLLGDSVMFKNGRVSLLGIGTEDGMTYHTVDEIVQKYSELLELAGLMIYTKETGEKTPLPWKAQMLKYPVVAIRKAKDVNRFIKK